MNHDEIARLIVSSAVALHREIGPGLLESVYELLLSDELSRQGLEVERQKPIPITFRGRSFDEAFRADLVVNDMVLVEIKSVESLGRVHHKQVLTYLRLTGLKLGFLLNFGGALMKNNMSRLVNQLDPTP